MRMALASLLSAVVLFFFGFLWWGVLMPVVKPAKVITDQELVTKLGALETDVHFYPDYASPEQAASSPTVMLYFHAAPPSMMNMMGLGFGHMFLTALFASFLVSKLACATLAERFGFVFCLGLFVAIWADIGNYIWWRYPPTWTCYHFCYDILSWSLAGFVIAKIVKPNAEVGTS